MAPAASATRKYGRFPMQESPPPPCPKAQAAGSAWDTPLYQGGPFHLGTPEAPPAKSTALMTTSAPDRSLLRPDTSSTLCPSAQKAEKEKEATSGNYAHLAKSPSMFAQGCGHRVSTSVEIFQNSWRHFLYASCVMWNSIVDDSRAEAFVRLNPMDCEKQAEWLREGHRMAGFTQSELTVEEMLAGMWTMLRLLPRSRIQKRRALLIFPTLRLTERTKQARVRLFRRC